MLSSVTGFFFGASATEADSITPVDLKTKDNNEGWVIVDVNESEEEEPVASRTRQQSQQEQPQQVVVVPRHRQPQLVTPSAGVNIQVQAVKAIRQQQRRNTKKYNKCSLERSNKCRDFQATGKKQRQRNRNLCKSGALNARYGQR